MTTLCCLLIQGSNPLPLFPPSPVVHKDWGGGFHLVLSQEVTNIFFFFWLRKKPPTFWLLWKTLLGTWYADICLSPWSPFFGVHTQTRDSSSRPMSEPHHQGLRARICPHPYQCLLFSVFLTVAILNSIRYKCMVFLRNKNWHKSLFCVTQ